MTHEDIEAVRSLLAEDCHSTTDKITETFSIDNRSDRSTIKDRLNIIHLCVVSIPYHIEGAQMERRFEIEKEWLSKFEALKETDNHN